MNSATCEQMVFKGDMDGVSGLFVWSGDMDTVHTKTNKRMLTGFGFIEQEN